LAWKEGGENVEGSRAHVACSLNAEQSVWDLDGGLAGVKKQGKNPSGEGLARDKLETLKRKTILQKQ